MRYDNDYYISMVIISQVIFVFFTDLILVFSMTFLMKINDHLREIYENVVNDVLGKSQKDRKVVNFP